MSRSMTSRVPSIAAGLAPLPPAPISSDDIRRNPEQTGGPPPALTLTSPPSVLSDPKQLVCPASFSLPPPCRFPPNVEVGGNSCPTTSDSRSCRGYHSTSCQNPRSTLRRLPLLPCSLLPFHTLSKPLAWKYDMTSPHSSVPPIAG